MIVLRCIDVKKNNFTFAIIIVIVVSLMIFLVFNNTSYKEGELIKLNYSEVSEKINNKDDFILVVSQSTCSHCATYKPKLTEITKEYGINIYYIDYDLESKDDRSKFLKEFNLSGATPTTLFFENGTEASVLNRIEGDLSEKKVTERFKKMGFIKE